MENQSADLLQKAGEKMPEPSVLKFISAICFKRQRGKSFLWAYLLKIFILLYPLS